MAYFSNGTEGLDVDTIGREWAIEWAAKNGQHGVVAMLKQEQESDHAQ